MDEIWDQYPDGWCNMGPLISELNVLLNHIVPNPNVYVSVASDHPSDHYPDDWNGEECIVFIEDIQSRLRVTLIDTKEKFQTFFGPNCFERCLDFVQKLQDQIMTLKMDLLKTKRAKNSYREVLDIVTNSFYASGDSRALEPIQEEIDDLERILEGLEEDIYMEDSWIVKLETITKILQN